MLCGKATQRHTGPRRRPLARPGRLPDAFTKGNITHLLASETTGALTPEVIRLLHVLDKSTNDAQGHDSTHYGLGRASPQSFFQHYLAAASCAIVRADALTIRATTQPPWPLTLLTASFTRGLSERPLDRRTGPYRVRRTAYGFTRGDGIYSE